MAGGPMRKVVFCITAASMLTIAILAPACKTPAKFEKESHIKKDRVVLKDVPLVIQKGKLDCGLASRAMLLRYYDNKISYEQSLYDSGACHSLAYKPGYLIFTDSAFAGDHKDFYWLADLYGLTFVPKRLELEQETGRAFGFPAQGWSRVLPAIVIVKDEQEAWNKFLDQICGYLEKGIPVQTSKSWLWKQVPPWFSGIPEEHLPGHHWMVVVGVDRRKGVVYIHSPWPTIGKTEMNINDFKRSIEAIPNQFRFLKYVTHVFLKSPFSGIEDRLKEVVERNKKKLRGDPRVYPESYVGWGFVFGLAGLRAFKEDLFPKNFRRIIKEMERRGITAYETTTWMGLCMYQYSFLSNFGAKYLKMIGKTDQEQRLLKKRHALYDRLHSSSLQLNSVFMASGNIAEKIVECEPTLEKMRKAIDEMIQSIEDYLSANP